MGLFNREPTLPIVHDLTAQAAGESVTEGTLTKPKLNDTILSYLDHGEQPHHILSNQSHGLRVNDRGSIQNLTSATGKATYVVLTDKRILFLVGQESKDLQLEVRYRTIQEFQVKSKLLSHRLTITTTDARYQTRVSKDTSTRVVADFLTRMTGLTPEGITPHESDRVTPAEPALLTHEELKQRLRSIDEFDFEYLIADVWRAQGWHTTVTQGTADRGIDVIAEQQEPVTQKHLIQVKRYREGNTVGSPEIQQYSSLRHQEADADLVIVVTTSTFTRQARQMAQDLNVKLIDGDGLCRMIEDHGLYYLLENYGAASAVSAQSTTAPHESLPNGGLQQAAPSAGVNQVNLKFGTLRSHAVVAVLTIWWTFGLGNLLYASLKHHRFTYPPDREITGSGGIPSWYYGILVGFAVAGVSIILGAVGLLPISELGLITAAALLPIATYFDVQYVRATTDWNPITGWWIVGMCLPTISLLVVPVYAVKRYRATGTWLPERIPAGLK